MLDDGQRGGGGGGGGSPEAIDIRTLIMLLADYHDLTQQIGEKAHKIHCVKISDNIVPGSQIAIMALQNDDGSYCIRLIGI